MVESWGFQRRLPGAAFVNTKGTLGFVKAIRCPGSVTSQQPSYGEGEGSILQTADQRGRGPMVLTHLIGCGCYFRGYPPLIQLEFKSDQAAFTSSSEMGHPDVWQ